MSYIELQIPKIDAEATALLKSQLNSFGDLFMGMEEYSIDEAEVDSFLGERSYSGGNLPTEVINEVDARYTRTQSLKLYFKSECLNEVNKLKFEISEKSECFLYQKEEVDWNAEWKKFYEPIEVTSELTIFPIWNKDIKGPRWSVYINPGMGFGTGSHETTFLCLKLLLKYQSIKPLKTVLDYGSGSGILGIGALKIFPNLKIDLVDIDPAAHANANNNVDENDIDQKLVRYLYPTDIEIKLIKYDLIFANILQNILFQERDFLVSALSEGGVLILSGLLLDQIKPTVEYYESLNLLTHVETITKNDWGAILFKKKNS